MKIKQVNILSLIVVIILSLSCNRVKTPDAAIEREQWIDGFTDSIDFYKDKINTIDKHLESLNSQISNMLQEFELVKNAKEVSGYYLLKGWKNKIPLKTTGIYARLSEDEKLELIATLAGGTFNQLKIGNSSESYVSEIMPHDQAFNFRHNGYNTVYFTGGKADTIANYIANNCEENLTLEFIDGSKKKSFLIPKDEKTMIYYTWELYESQTRVHQLQKELWIDSKKVETFRRILDTEKTNK